MSFKLNIFWLLALFPIDRTCAGPKLNDFGYANNFNCIKIINLRCFSIHYTYFSYLVDGMSFKLNIFWLLALFPTDRTCAGPQLNDFGYANNFDCIKIIILRCFSIHFTYFSYLIDGMSLKLNIFWLLALFPIDRACAGPQLNDFGYENNFNSIKIINLRCFSIHYNYFSYLID